MQLDLVESLVILGRYLMIVGAGVATLSALATCQVLIRNRRKPARITSGEFRRRYGLELE